MDARHPRVSKTLSPRFQLRELMDARGLFEISVEAISKDHSINGKIHEPNFQQRLLGLGHVYRVSY